jgi:hypothetical protein
MLTNSLRRATSGYAKPYEPSLIVDRVRGQQMQCCVGGDERVQIAHHAVLPQERARVPARRVQAR